MTSQNDYVLSEHTLEELTLQGMGARSPDETGCINVFTPRKVTIYPRMNLGDNLVRLS